MAKANPEKMWRSLAEEVQYYHGPLNRDFPEDRDRAKVLGVLREYVKRFEAFEKRHPDYRPMHYEGSDGEWDVCAGLHLLKVAVELAAEAHFAHRASTMRQKWREQDSQKRAVERASQEADGQTQH